jgi:hypothetical protein
MKFMTPPLLRFNYPINDIAGDFTLHTDTPKFSRQTQIDALPLKLPAVKGMSKRSRVLPSYKCMIAKPDRNELCYKPRTVVR